MKEKAQLINCSFGKKKHKEVVFLNTNKQKTPFQMPSQCFRIISSPRYQLFLLYPKTGEKEKAENMANNIIQIKPNNDNERIREIRNQLLKKAF